MNEDQIIPVPDPVVPVAAAESASTASSGEGFVDLTHKIPVIPPDLSNVLQPVRPPIHALEDTGGTETPAKLGDGSSVDLSPPDGFSTKEDALGAVGGKANDWRANAGKVFERQFTRIRALKKAA